MAGELVIELPAVLWPGVNAAYLMRHTGIGGISRHFVRLGSSGYGTGGLLAVPSERLPSVMPKLPA